MQDKNQNGTDTSIAKQASAPTISKVAQNDYVKKIVEKIKKSENILVALSKNPSVDDIAAAIALTLFLDGLQHHVTAIYSGKTPETLAFLRPDATFETNTDSLQDFIIALNKDKADHLRYKIEGDFVKVFITPYKTTIDESDLTFSHGDYNVDFVIAIDVPSVGDLDGALAEHGRIMHDASAVDITTGAPGRFGEIEWSNPTASSVSEMVTELIFALQGGDKPLDGDVATALLTGIVAATERFSNPRTTPGTLTLASKLMLMGADQQLITANVVDNRVLQAEGPKEQDVASIKPDMEMNAVVDELPPAVATNPAAQVARGMVTVTGPDPAQMTIPNVELPTENVAPVDVSGTVVKPVVMKPVDDPSMMRLPGVNMPTVAPTAPIASVAPGVNVAQKTMAAAPASQTTAENLPPQVGAAVSRPMAAPVEKPDYGRMMEQVLGGNAGYQQPVAISSMNIPAPDPNTVAPANVQPVAQTTPQAMSASAPVNTPTAAVNTGQMQIPNTPVMNSQSGVGGVTSGTMTLPGQPVEKTATVLPPPPAPPVGEAGVMPPSLPPVQG